MCVCILCKSMFLSSLLLALTSLHSQVVLATHRRRMPTEIVLFGLQILEILQVVVALRTIGGEQAVLSALGRARDVYQNRSRTLEATDELTALFAQCAIATLPPSDLVVPSDDMAVETTTTATTMSSQVEMEMMDQNNNHIRGLGSSILAESGREQVVWDASADGSSFLCQQCGGVVSNLRRDEHFAHWCSAPRSR